MLEFTMSAKPIMLRFDAGTLLLDGAGSEFSAPAAFRWDERVSRWRAPALAYREAVRELVRRKVAYEDQARAYQEFDFPSTLSIEPRPYQQEAIREWQQARRSGVVILPTGAGKSLVAQMAIELTKRSTLVVVPTIDLMNQWYDLLLSSFQAEVGLIGGGYFETGALTVTTYASAFRFMERMGNQFGLLIFDECHHLPSSIYRYAAPLAIHVAHVQGNGSPFASLTFEIFAHRLLSLSITKLSSHTGLLAARIVFVSQILSSDKFEHCRDMFALKTRLGIAAIDKVGTGAG
jgi:hypothetical protein